MVSLPRHRRPEPSPCICCRLDLFCMGKYLRKCQETLMPKCLRLKNVCEIHHNDNHYITIEIFLRSSCLRFQKFAKNSFANKFQFTISVWIAYRALHADSSHSHTPDIYNNNGGTGQEESYRTAWDALLVCTLAADAKLLPQNALSCQQQISWEKITYGGLAKAPVGRYLSM